MYQRSREDGIDRDLVARIAGLSPAGQRWLRTAILAVEGLDVADRAGGGRPARRPPVKELPQRPPRPRKAADLEDVVKGKSTLDEQLEEYPELSEEMEGLAEVIDMLREHGAARRRTGEQILREEILGRPAESEDDSEEDDPEGDEETP
jgi:hypothetical protein